MSTRETIAQLVDEASSSERPATETEDGGGSRPDADETIGSTSRPDADDTVVALSPIDLAAEIAAAEAAEARLASAVAEPGGEMDEEPIAEVRPAAPSPLGSALFTLAAAALCVAFSAVVYGVASGWIEVVEPGYIAAACQLFYGLCIIWLFGAKDRQDQRTRDSMVGAALSALARGSRTPLVGGDPLAPAFEETAARIEAAQKERLDAVSASVRKDSHVELVRVKSQCERLVEKYAERLHREKKETEALHEELKKRHDEEKRDWRAEAHIQAQRISEAESSLSVAENRAGRLSADLDDSKAECVRLGSEVDRLLQEVDKLRKQNIRFFDKVAAQLRGSLQIAAKLTSDLCSKSQGARGRAPAPAGSAQKPVDASAQEILARIQRTERLVDQIVDLCRMETSTMSLVYSESDVVALIKDCLAEVRDTAAEKTIDLTLRSPKTMPGVITDARLLVRVVRELVSNAVRFTPKGGRVSLGLNVTPQHPMLVPTRDRTAEWLRVDVSDNGPGIAPEDRDRIFAAFERGAEPQFTVSDASPGLGLTLAKHYAELLGGDILLDTTPGKGSTFSLLLPVKVCVVTHIA